MQAQSFVSTLMRARMGVYESRIFMRIVEKCQVLLPTSPFKAMPYEVPGGWSYQFAFTLSSLTTSHNYRYVKAACANLKNITVQSYDIDRKRWMMAGLITQARIDEQSGILKIEVADWVCSAILDFRQGWRSYDIEQAMRIHNPFALRMYLITCTQNKTLNFSIGYIKGLLLGQDTHAYANNGDFIRKVIKPAANELQKLGLNGFDYKPIKTGGCQKGKIEKVQIIPVKREKRDTANISDTRMEMEKTLPSSMLQYLTLQCGFSTRELSGKNLATLAKFAALKDWEYKLVSLVTRWRKHRYGHGWLINAIKNITKEENGKSES